MSTQDLNVSEDPNGVPACLLECARQISATTLCVAFNTQACDSSSVLNRIRELDGVDCQYTDFVYTLRLGEEATEIRPGEYRIDDEAAFDPYPSEASVHVKSPEDLARVQAQIAAMPGVASVCSFGSSPT